MKFSFRMLLWGVAVVAFASGSALAAPAPQPIRHLVYDFTYDSTTDTTVHDSGIGGGPVSGSSDYGAALGDKGQILVDVMAAPADASLVVSVSEQSRNERDAVPATCAVWGNTNVVCDPAKKVTEEEFALLRFLGRNFVSPAQMDAKNHWSEATSAKDLTINNDFTIDNTDGSGVHIVESRILKQGGAQSFAATTDGSIDYSTAMSIPSDLTERTTTRSNTGMGDYSETLSVLVLKLNSDSLAKAAQ